MLELKFRAWNKIRNSYWGVVTQFVFENSPQGVYRVEVMGSDGSTEWYNGEDCIIEQFTGLYDMKGKEIYEGDIIRGFLSNGEDITHVIEYDAHAGRYNANQQWIDLCKKEAIGNIHESPELLK